MGKQQTDTDTQAQVFSHYLIGQLPHADAILLYNKAMANSRVLSRADQRLLEFILVHRWAIGAVDGALALIQPQSEVRRRIYLMFSILEARPEYTQSFLPQSRSAWYWVMLIVIGARAIIKALIGLFVVKVIAR